MSKIFGRPKVSDTKASHFVYTNLFFCEINIISIEFSDFHFSCKEPTVQEQWIANHASTLAIYALALTKTIVHFHKSLILINLNKFQFISIEPLVFFRFNITIGTWIQLIAYSL